jgi:hypothetical protein
MDAKGDKGVSVMCCVVVELILVSIFCIYFYSASSFQDDILKEFIFEL